MHQRQQLVEECFPRSIVCTAVPIETVYFKWEKKFDMVYLLLVPYMKQKVFLLVVIFSDMHENIKKNLK